MDGNCAGLCVGLREGKAGANFMPGVSDMETPEKAAEELRKDLSGSDLLDS